MILLLIGALVAFIIALIQSPKSALTWALLAWFLADHLKVVLALLH